MAALQPRTLRDEEHIDRRDVVRFLFLRGDDPATDSGTIEIVYRDRDTGKTQGYRFRGVKLNYLSIITPADDAKLTVVNNALRKHDPNRQEPRMLEVRLSVWDEVNEVLFWASSVEPCDE